MKKLIAAASTLALLFGATPAFGQELSTASYRLGRDGRILVSGTGDLSGIVLKSAGGFLSFEQVEAVPGTGVMVTQRLPFFDARLVGADEIISVDGTANVPNDVAVFKEDAHEIQYGIVGPGNRIRINGCLQTSVFHSGRLLTTPQFKQDLKGSGLGIGDSPTLLAQFKSYGACSLTGDFNSDGSVDAIDIDLLSEAVRVNPEMKFDLNGDGAIDDLDRVFWVEEVVGTHLGDVDLNLAVDFEDFLALSAGFDQAGGWSDGDVDGNAFVNFDDFLVLSGNFGQSAGEVAAVPEPTSGNYLCLVFVGLLSIRRRQTRC